MVPQLRVADVGERRVERHQAGGRRRVVDLRADGEGADGVEVLCRRLVQEGVQRLDVVEAECAVAVEQLDGFLVSAVEC